MRLQFGNVLSVEDNASTLRLIEARDDIEETGLTRAIRTDYGRNLPGTSMHAHAAQRFHATEGELDAVYL